MTGVCRGTVNSTSVAGSATISYRPRVRITSRRWAVSIVGAAPALMVAALPLPAAAVQHAIPAGQENVLGTLLGRGIDLPGGCRLASGGVEPTGVTAEYHCRDGAVVLELRHPDDAPLAALRTKRFAIVPRGAVPSDLTEALL